MKLTPALTLLDKPDNIIYIMYKPYFLKDVIDNSNKELFTVISTFAGGGGSSTGYRLAGGKILCVNEFGKLGYEAVGKVLNAADYGTPQGRQRCFFIAVRNDIMDKAELNFMTMENELYPEPHKQQVSLKEAIEDVQNDEEEEKQLYEYVQGGFQKKWVEILPFNPNRHIKPSENDIRIIPKDKWPEYKEMGFQEKNAKPIVSNSNITIDQLMKTDVKHYEWDTDKEYYYVDINYKKSMFNMIRPAIDKPCPTLTQRGQQMSVSGVFHYNKNRKFTIKELIRIMGLPDDYNLQGKFDQKAERIGRMVAPLMMKNLASNIYEKVLKRTK